MSIIEHFTYEAARKELREALDNFRPGHMVFLIGPSGAGKTTMRHAVMQEIFGNPTYWGKGRIPVIQTSALLPNNAYFSSKELVKSLVEQLHTPSLRWLFSENCSLTMEIEKQFEDEIQHARSIWGQLGHKFMTKGDYWRVFQRSLAARKCKYVSIEQANCLLKNRKNTSPADHTLHLLTIAEAAGIMFIMTGVAECTKLWATHHELQRRVINVWFRPYSPQRKEDNHHFLRLLKTIGAKYTFSRPDLLHLMANDLMAATGGLVGHLVEVLISAQIKAKLAGGVAIRKQHIEESFRSEEDLAKIWKDVQSFETACLPGNIKARSELIKSEWIRSMSGEPKPSGTA